MKIRYDQVRLFDASGRESYTYRPGDSITIRGTLVSEIPGTGVNMIIKIFNRFGGHAATIESRWTGQGYEKFGARLSFEIRLPALQLVQGDYYMEFAMRDENHLLTDNLTHFLLFSVGPKHNDERDNLGILYMDPVWKFQETDDTV